MDEHDRIVSVRTFRSLRFLVSQSEDGLEKHVLSKLRIGDVWWIPDAVTGFSNKERHPWVITQGYSARRASVIACPRTTTGKTQGILTPSAILPGLERPGIILVGFRRQFLAKAFRGYEYVGRLPKKYIDEIEDWLLEFAKGKAKK